MELSLLYLNSLSISASQRKKVIFLTPSYAYFKYAADYNHRECVCSDLINDNGRYHIDFDDFERKAANEKNNSLDFV
ncbi:hypothetical protein GCM10020331_094640 [Ectobacillus funiculus]